MASELSKTVTALRPTPDQVQNDPRAVLSESEQKMYTEVLTHFTKPEYALPGAEKGELMDVEKFWLSRECILRCVILSYLLVHRLIILCVLTSRFLRATKWKVPDAIQRLEGTLKWRREFGMYDLVTADLVEPEV